MNTMRNSIALAALALAACSTVSEVLPVGVGTYSVSSRMGGQLPAWSEVKALSIKRANEFCAARNEQMAVGGWETHGARGWTPLDATLTFKCVKISPAASSN
jgi:hypothetical protein